MKQDGGVAIGEVTTGRSETCRTILEALPDWFGIPEAIDDYAEAAASLPMFAAFGPDGAVVGFLSLKRQTAAVSEAYVLGVRSEWQGQGIGRRLFDAAVRHARDRGARYLSVKTLAPEAGYAPYLRTLQFYLSIGFEPVEVFPTLWSPDDPCLLLIRPI